MESRKVLVVCQGYYKSTVIRQLLPWEELGYRLIMGLNSYYSISAIRKINPDVLIVVDYVPGQTIGALLEMYRHTALPTRIILVPYEKNLVSEEDRKAFQVIPWDDLTAENLTRAMEAIFEDPARYRQGIFPDVSEVDPFRSSLEKYARLEPSIPVLPLRILFRDVPEGKYKTLAENIMRSAIDRIGGGAVLEEAPGRFYLLCEVPTNLLGDGFWRLNRILEETQNYLSTLAETSVVIFLGEIVSNRNVQEEHEKLVSLEPYAFFHSHHGIQSATFIQRHTLNDDLPMAGVISEYAPLLKALIQNDEERIRELLEDIYLRKIKVHQNMAFYRLVRLHLMAIYSCACSINDKMHPDFSANESFWCIEDALEDQIRRFTEHFPVEKNDRSPGKLTEEALELILQFYNRPIYAAAIAERIGVSEAHLGRTFKKDLGIGITECIRNIRIYLSAIDLYGEQYSVKEVAQKHGFEDPKYFNKVFKKVMGQSPTEWIRSQKEEA